MDNYFEPNTGAGWGGPLREAAIRAAPNNRRGMWLGAAAAGAILGFVGVLIQLQGVGGRSGGVGDLGRALDQARGLAVGTLPVDGLYPFAYPLWLLVVSRFTNDLEMAARILSGLSAVLALFVAYQLCHGLTTPDRADEQACFSLLALALSPSFFLAAAGGATEMPHLALLLLALLCIQRSLGSGATMAPVAMAGLLVGVSVLVKPISVLLAVAVLLWLWLCRPYGTDLPRSNARPGIFFTAAFTVGFAPQIAMSLSQGTPLLPWGLREFGWLISRLGTEPLVVAQAAAASLADYIAADDFERISSVSSSWRAGAWGSIFAAIIALAPTIIKALGGLGLFVLCWFERFEDGVERARLPAFLIILLAITGGLAFADGRGRLPVETVLVLFAFAGLPSLVPGGIGGVLGLSLVGLMVLHQVGVGQPSQLAPTYRAADQISLELRTNGAIPSKVMSANWAYYDTRSPWHERYLHLPVYVDSFESLVSEMKRQGATYLVFDRQAGANQWPKLSPLIETDAPRFGLRPVRGLIRTDEPASNTVAIYRLE